jgi:hypothetical protein
MATSSPQTESESNVGTGLRSLGSRRRATFAGCALAVLAALAAGGAAAGEDQDFEDFFGGYTHRVEGVTVGAGDAAASNTASQIINPWPAYSRDRAIRSESSRMIGAIRRYQANTGGKFVNAPIMPQSRDGAENGGEGDMAAKPGGGSAPSPDVSAGE